MYASLLALTAAAWAHPMGSNLIGHRMDLTLDPPVVLVDYTAEIPTSRVLRAVREAAGGHLSGPAATDAGIASVEADLSAGLRLLVDEAPVPLRARATPATPSGDSRFVRFVLPLEADLPPGARTLQLVNGSLPDEPALFLSAVQVSDAVLLDDSDLFEKLDGRLGRDLDDQWRMEEQARELRLSFRFRPAWLARVRRGLRALVGEGPTIPARDAFTGAAPFSLARWAPEAVSLALLLGAAGGGWVLRRALRKLRSRRGPDRKGAP